MEEIRMRYLLKSLSFALLFAVFASTLLIQTDSALAQSENNLNGADSTVLAVAPASFAFTLNQGDSLVGESLHVYEVGGQSINFWTYNYSSWLELDTMSATPLYTPRTIFLNVRTHTLAPGTYTDTIFIWAPEASNSPQAIPVSLTVEGTGSDYIVATQPTSFHFWLTPGDVQFDSLYVYEIHGHHVPFTFTNREPWLQVYATWMPPFSTPMSLQLIVTDSALVPGTYVDTIFLLPDSDIALFPPVAVPVMLTVEGEGELVVEPSSFEFVASPGDTLSDSLYIYAKDSGIVVQLDFFNSSSWLRLPEFFAPPTTPCLLPFGIITVSLEPGIYHDSIVITGWLDNTVPYDEVVVPVTLMVEEEGPTTLVVEPTSFEFTFPPDYVAVDVFHVWEAHGQNVIFSFYNGSTWLSLPHVFNMVTPDSVIFTVHTDSLPFGVYYDTIVIETGSAPSDPRVKIPVTLAVRIPGPVVRAVPDHFEFLLNPGDTLNGMCMLVYEESGDAVPFMAQTTGGSNWLQLYPDTTWLWLTPDSVCFDICTGELAPGIYTDTILIYNPFDDTLWYENVKVPITLTVEGGDSTELVVYPTSFDLTMPPGSLIIDSVFHVWEAHGRNVMFSLSNHTIWLSLPPNINMVTPDSVPFTVYEDTLPLGVYYDTIVVFETGEQPSNSPVHIPVTLTVGGSGYVVATQPSSFQFWLTPRESTHDSLFVYEILGRHVPFTFSNSEPWLEVEPAWMPPYVTPMMLHLFARAACPDPGTYTDTIIIEPAPGLDTILFPTVKIPVVQTVYPAAPVVKASPDHFEFTLGPGDTLTNVGMWVYEEDGGTIPFVVETIMGSSWLQLRPDTSWFRLTPDSVFFNVCTGGLIPGTYTDTILIWYPFGDTIWFEDVKVPVTLTVTGAPPDYIVETTPTYFRFILYQNQTAHDPLHVYEVYGRSVEFYCSESSPWLTVSSMLPITPYVTPMTLTVGVVTDTLPIGIYTDSIYIFPDTDGIKFPPVIVPVVLAVLPAATADSLIIPSEVIDQPCGGLQAVACALSQPASGATIPIKIPDGVEVMDVHFDSLLTEGWDFKLVDIKNDSGFVVVNLANSHGWYLPGNSVTILFFMEFTAPGICRENRYIHWDTALAGDPSRQLKFADTLFNTFIPGFDYYRDSTEIRGYTPGDCDGQPDVDIGDLTYMISYIFFGSEPPCMMNSVDVNGDCAGPDIGDITYLISYLFIGGEEPRCGCIDPGVWATQKATSDIRILTAYENGVTTISLSSGCDLRGLQLELNGPGDAAPEILVSDKLDLVYGQADGLHRLGIVDLDGGEMIKAGVTSLIQLDGEYEIVSALVSDNNHRVTAPLIASGKAESLPEDYALEQNYPNPFNPTTAISFNLREAQDVKLEIYNITGQKVTTLVAGRLEAGRHTIEWNATDVASGVYLYRLETGEFTDTKKMLLLK